MLIVKCNALSNMQCIAVGTVCYANTKLVSDIKGWQDRLTEHHIVGQLESIGLCPVNQG